jgi:polysaccharide pyruvyl transferase WcaK-like protein
MTQLSRTIAIKGGYGYGNFGDDALMAAVHEVATKLCRPDEAGYLCQDSAYTRKLTPNASILKVRDADRLSVRMLLFGGGTQFYSFARENAAERGFTDRAIRLLRQPGALPLKIARRFVRTHPKELPDEADSIAALGVGVGPFVPGSAAETRAKDLFSHMTFISVRDARSYEMCRQWGATNLHHHTDLCFWPGFHAAHVPQVEPAAAASIKRVGLVVRDWSHDAKGDSYGHSLLEVADELTKAGRTVDFVLFAGRHDRVWLQRLKATRFKAVLWTPENDTIRDFAARLNSYDLFITARYHGAAFATLLGKPSICIEVEPKLALFAKVLGPAGRCWKHPFDALQCLRLVQEIEADMPRVIALLWTLRQMHSDIATRMVDEFLAFARPRLTTQHASGAKR